ncbi:MAG: acyl-CoA/acyl-ACP dehydrogenase [Pseudomonadota bacterium]|nr:acyl-CoA/acyl-ACP dehydrogenase [Pseudomonadota bacterium]
MSAELNELRDSARQVLGELGIAADESRSWPHFIELGWLLVAVPEELGGLGQGTAGACAFHAELGRSLATASYASAMLAIDAVCQSVIADRASWIERLTTSEYAATPLASGALVLQARTLSGLLSAVPSADRASHVLVTTADGALLALVPLAQAGIERIARPTWDATRRLYNLRFNVVSLDGALILAEGAAAQTLSRRIETLRDFALAADAVGGAEALLAMTVDYLQTRRQFSRPLALFQALKHRCADLKMLTVSAQALLQDKLSRLDGDSNDAAAVNMARIAKLHACKVYAQVAEEALQLHGGIGMTSEHACHLYLKRALLNEQLGQPGGSYELDIADAFLSRTT